MPTILEIASAKLFFLAKFIAERELTFRDDLNNQKLFHAKIKNKIRCFWWLVV